MSIKFENTEVVGWEAAIRGMRNPMNSWDKSDSDCAFHMLEKFTNEDLMSDKYREWNDTCGMNMILGPNDMALMKKLAANGSVHAKYRRMIVVYVDITAPLYWWKEFDTYKVGTVANSCSTMHKIHEKKFTLDDFSTEHLMSIYNSVSTDSYFALNNTCWHATDLFGLIINMLNYYRNRYLQTKDKTYWWQMIQLLPSSYNQRRTVMLNYEVLAGIYPMRKDHKLDEWQEFCSWIEGLPYSELITGDKE